MTMYIVQGRYTRSAIVGMLKEPEDRAKAVSALTEAVGGKILDYYVTFGKSDFLLIIEGGEGRSETDTLAALMVAGATGGVTDLTTTVAVHSEEAMQAMRTAGEIMEGFRPAGQAS